MRIDNAKTFDRSSRNKYYRVKPKQSDMEAAAETDFSRIVYRENALPIFSKACQTIIDNPDGGKEMLLSVNIDGTKPLFIRIKLVDTSSDLTTSD